MRSNDLYQVQLLDKMSIEPQFTCRTYLFSVRIWAEDLGEGEREWLGKVEYMPRRGARYFRE